jgi:hypothetical protein
MTKGAWPQGAAVNDPGVIVFYTTNDNDKAIGTNQTYSQLFRLRGRKLKSRYAIFGARTIEQATIDLKEAPYLKKYKWRRAYFIGHGAACEFMFDKRFLMGYSSVLKHPQMLERAQRKYQVYYKFINALGKRLHPSKDPERPNEVGFLSCFTGENVEVPDGLGGTDTVNLIKWVYDQLKAMKIKKRPKFPYLKVGGYTDFYLTQATPPRGTILYWMDCIVPDGTVTTCNYSRLKAKGRNEIPKYQVVKGPP